MISRPILGGCIGLVAVLVAVGFDGGSSRIRGGSCCVLEGEGDPMDNSLVVCRAQVCVLRGHLNRLVTGSNLNLLDRRAIHRKPGTECMPVAMPYKFADLGFIEAPIKPASVVEVLRVVREHDVTALLASTLHRLDRFQSFIVEMDSPARSVLCLRQLDRLSVEGDLVPRHRVLLGEAHPTVDTDDELSNVFRVELLDGLEEAEVFLVGQEANAARWLLSLSNKACRIDINLAVDVPLFVNEAEERAIAVLRCWRLEALLEPGVNLLWLDARRNPGAEHCEFSAGMRTSEQLPCAIQ